MSGMDSMYALFGDANHTLSIPKAHQSAPPFGVDIGGTNPQVSRPPTRPPSRGVPPFEPCRCTNRCQTRSRLTVLHALQFWPYAAEAQYDSWLTVSVDDASAKDQLSSIGIDFSGWTAESRLDINDGAVRSLPHCCPCASSFPPLVQGATAQQ